MEPQSEPLPRELKIGIDGTMVTIEFPSLRQIYLPLGNLSNNSKYFMGYAEMKTEGNMNLAKSERINLVEMGWSEFDEGCMIEFFLWIGSNQLICSGINEIGLIHFAVLGDYFLINPENVSHLKERLKNFKIENVFPAIKPLWKSRLLSFEYFSYLICLQFERNSVISAALMKRLYCSKCKNNTGIQELILTPGVLLDYCLIWVDDEFLLTLSHPEYDQGFQQLSMLINKYSSFFIPKDRDQLISVVKKYKIAYKTLDLILALSISR
jgi:hypothetical protein